MQWVSFRRHVRCSVQTNLESNFCSSWFSNVSCRRFAVASPPRSCHSVKESWVHQHTSSAHQLQNLGRLAGKLELRLEQQGARTHPKGMRHALTHTNTHAHTGRDAVLSAWVPCAARRYRWQRPRAFVGRPLCTRGGCGAALASPAPAVQCVVDS